MLAFGSTHRPGRRLQLGRKVSQGADVAGRGAATAADHLHPEVFDEVHQLHLHLHRRQPVMGHTADVLRQSGVGDAAHHKGAVLAQVADVLLHLLRAGGAVEAEHINRKRLENRHHSGDVGAHQHCAGGLHRHAHHQRPALAGFAERGLNALQRCLDLQHVLAGFDDEQVDVASQQPFGLLGEGGFHRVEIDVPQGRQLGGGPHRAGYKAGLLGGGVGIRHLAGQFGSALVEGKGLIGDVVFRQHQGGGSEGVGLDHIGTHLQKLAMHGLHRIRAGEHQDFVAALQRWTAEVVGAQVHLLQRGAGGTVEHEHGPLGRVQPLQKTHPLSHPGCHRRAHLAQPSTRIRVTQWS